MCLATQEKFTQESDKIKHFLSFLASEVISKVTAKFVSGTIHQALQNNRNNALSSFNADHKKQK